MKILDENKSIQIIMLIGSATFLICKEIRYTSFSFRYYSPLWNSKSVPFIRKFVIYIRIQNFAQISSEFYWKLKKTLLYPKIWI